MPEPLVYVQAMAGAAAVSAVFVLATVAMRRHASAMWLNGACVLGITCGLAVGFSLLGWRWVWPPINGLDRFLAIVIPVALGIELTAGFPSLPRWVAWLLRISLALVIPRILLHGSVYLGGSSNDWPLWRVCVVLAIGSATLAGVWSLLSWLSRRSPGVSIPLALCLSTQCAGLTVMMAGYIKGGAAAFPLVATLLATTAAVKLITIRGGGLADFGGPAISGIGVVGLFSVLFIGRFFGALSTGSALAMLFAPILCWATEWTLLRHRKPWIVGSIRLALVAIPLLVVLTLAKRDFDREMGPLLGQLFSQRVRCTYRGQAENCENRFRKATGLTGGPIIRHRPILTYRISTTGDGSIY